MRRATLDYHQDQRDCTIVRTVVSAGHIPNLILLQLKLGDRLISALTLRQVQGALSVGCSSREILFSPVVFRPRVCCSHLERCSVNCHCYRTSDLGLTPARQVRVVRQSSLEAVLLHWVGASTSVRASVCRLWQLSSLLVDSASRAVLSGIGLPHAGPYERQPTTRAASLTSWVKAAETRP